MNKNIFLLKNTKEREQKENKKRMPQTLLI